MARLLATVALAVLLGMGGAVAAWRAEDSALAAGVLHAEPLILVAIAWGIAGLRWSGLPRVALGLSAGAVLFSLGLRLPFPVVPHDPRPPTGLAKASTCAAALPLPDAPVRVLQWTLDADADREAIRALVSTEAPDVVVLHGVTTDAQADALLDGLGGNAERLRMAEGGVAIAATGGFHPCGAATQWAAFEPTGEGYGVVFAGVPPATVFPLVVGSLPGPLARDGASRAHAASQALLDAVTAVRGASAVVVADTRAPRTLRALSARMVGLGMLAAPVPPNWPARLGVLPSLPLHPYTRVWAGPAWGIALGRAPRAPEGHFTPVIEELVPVPTDDDPEPPR